jgi:hypothetical protein
MNQSGPVASNPLLERVKIPGRIFQLPSAGLFYTNGELDEDVENGEIHVYPMTAIDELNMKNPDMLFSGKAISIVFRHCVPSVKKPEELFAKDIDALMIFLRLVTYGPKYEIEAQHSCENSKGHSYLVDVEQIANTMKVIDHDYANEHFSVSLNNGQTVKMSPIRYKNVIKLMMMNENKKELTVADQEKNLITNLINIIESVDEVTDKKQIAEWLHVVSPQMMNELATAIENSQSWGPDTNVELICKDCSQPFKVDVPINPISFFSV